jgi:peptidoglycan-N-acetylglucosamine deacetylase
MRGSDDTTAPVYVTTSWDDGAIHDIRLCELLLKYSIPATFYIPKNLTRRGLSDEQVKEIGTCFEIGGHGIHHRNLATCSVRQVDAEIYETKSYLEDLVGSHMTSFAYPYGAFSEIGAKVLRDAGFASARTTCAFSEPHTDWAYAQGVTLQAAPYSQTSLYEQMLIARQSRLPKLLMDAGLDLKKPIRWADLALLSFEVIREFGGVWHLWGHSWEIENHNLWAEVETVIARVSSTRQRISFVRNSEIPSVPLRVNKYDVN